MKRLFYACAGAALVSMLTAGLLAAQGRTPPGGGGGGGGGGQSSGSSGGGSSSGGGGATVRSGGSPGGGGYSGGGGGGTAVVRGSAGGGSGRSSSSGGEGAVVRSYGGRTTRTESYGSSGDVAIPRGARPNYGAPVTGGAVLRGDGQHYVPRPEYYTAMDWYRLYGFGAFGLGYYSAWPYYWDGWYGSPYWGWGWDPLYYGGNAGGYYGGGGGYYGTARQGGPLGGVKLKVKPNDAEVYVDGYFMGVVDDFDGVFQHLSLEAGTHRLEIRASGYEPVTFEVRVEPREVITYRTEMRTATKR